MSSPQSVVFFLYDPLTGFPALGELPTFYSYQDTDGSAVAPPTITEIPGAGAYIFTPVFPTDKGIVYTISSDSTAIPLLQSGFIRPEDYNVDLLTDLNDEHFGKWVIETTGPDANRLVLYREDGITVLKKFNLYDSSGFPSTANPFQRVPVP